MVFVLIPDKVADNVTVMTPVRQKMCIGYWIEASKDHRSIHQDIPKGYATVLKMYTPILVTKLEGVNGYAQSHANQDVVWIILLIHGNWCEYNSERQEIYEIMQAKKHAMMIWKTKDNRNDGYKKVFKALIDVV